MRSQVIKFKEKAFFTFVNILKRGIATGKKDLLVILRGKNENSRSKRFPKTLLKL